MALNHAFENDESTLICPECYTSQVVTVRSERGDPRNVPLILHWDAFQGFGISGPSRSVGSFEYQYACLDKSERIRRERTHVLVFVPNERLQNSPLFIQAFLEKIVDEVEESFINGTHQSLTLISRY
jgi:hypothetical protein